MKNQDTADQALSADRALGENSEKPESAPRENPIARFFGFVSACMTPLLPAMLGSGMVKLLTALLTTLRLLSEASLTYTILHATGNAFFYFFPLLLANSAAKRIGSNPIYSMLAAAFLLYPDIAARLSEGGISGVFSLSSVLLVLIIVPLIKSVEKFADMILPSSVKPFWKPMLMLLITLPLSLALAGPIGGTLRKWLADGIRFLYPRAGWLTVLLLSAAMPLLIFLGIQPALLLPTALAADDAGYTILFMVALLCWNLAQGGAALGAALRTKDKSMRQTALGAGLTALVAGVSEPAFYGVSMKLPRTLPASCIAAGAGGLFAGIRQLTAYSTDPSPSILSLTRMVGDTGYGNFLNGVVTVLLVPALSFGLTMLFTAEKKPVQTVKEAQKSAGASAIPASAEVEATNPLPSLLVIGSPLSGKVIPLSEVKDAAFSSGVMGRGCAVIPDEGKLFAPCDCKVATLSDSFHALGLECVGGIELMIHIGRDTAALNPNCFLLCCKAGDEVKEGDLLLSFDMEAMEKAQCDLTTPILVTNFERFAEINLTCAQKVTVGDSLLTLIPKAVKG